MPEPISFKQLRSGYKGMQKGGEVVTVNDSIPNLDLEIPVRPSLESASLFHLVRTLEQMIIGLETLCGEVNALVKNVEKERNFIDMPTQLGLTIGYTVNYQGRKFLFLYSAGAITLALSDGTTKSVSAHTWTNISYPRGTIITVSSGSDTSPAVVTIRACDFLLSTS